MLTFKTDNHIAKQGNQVANLEMNFACSARIHVLFVQVLNISNSGTKQGCINHPNDINHYLPMVSELVEFEIYQQHQTSEKRQLNPLLASNLSIKEKAIYNTG